MREYIFQITLKQIVPLREHRRTEVTPSFNKRPNKDKRKTDATKKTTKNDNLGKISVFLDIITCRMHPQQPSHRGD